MNLRAGASAIDITPPVGVLLDGYGARTKPSEGVHDPLFARALVLDYEDGGAAAIVGCDLLGMHPWITGEVRRRAEEAYGIPTDGVMVSATHNHAGPAGLREGMFARLDEALAEEVAGKIVQAIGDAWEGRRPVTTKVGAVTVDTVAMNRRDPEGPVDAALPVVLFESEDGPVACLINFACHATVLDGRNLMLSAEFPGVACRIVHQATGAGVVYLNGACGDVNPAWVEQEFPSVERAGQAVGGQAVSLIADLRAAGRGLRSHNIRWDEYLPLASPGRVVEPRLQYQRREIELPQRVFLEDDEYARRLDAAREEAAKHPAGSPERRGAMAEASRWESERWAAVWARRSGMPGSRQTEIQTISLGEGLALLALPGEFFAETAAGVRASTGVHDLLVACYANDYLGYVVPEAEYDRGGYETGITFFAPEAESIIRETAIEMLRQVTSKW
jgi:hypothetical protein